MFTSIYRSFLTINPIYTCSSSVSLLKNPLHHVLTTRSISPGPISTSPARYSTAPLTNKKDKKKSKTSDIQSSVNKDSQGLVQSVDKASFVSSQTHDSGSAADKTSKLPGTTTKGTKTEKSQVLETESIKDVGQESNGSDAPKETKKKVKKKRAVRAIAGSTKAKKASSTNLLKAKSTLPLGRQRTLLNILGDVEMPEASKEAVLKAFKLTVASRVSPKTKKTSKSSQSSDSSGKDSSISSQPQMDKFQTMDAKEIPLTPVDDEEIHVPTLSYGLDRVLFNHGVYQLQDPRTRVFNFDPYLQEIMPVNQFDYGALRQYITSSRDVILLAKANKEKRKYAGSTSSMSSALSHFHFLLSDWRPIEYGNLSGALPSRLKSSNFTLFTRAPSAIFLRYRNGSYAIDADKEFDDSNILAMLGKSMEKLLTLPTEHYEKYRLENSGQLTEKERNERESYHYTTFGDFLLRSQLDAYDPRLPGTGTFDLKTRCVISVRMDVSEYENSKAYEIRKAKGEWESYEREYYDMIRAAFLKYSMQVRMGRMDGIFVAFHNTARIFGFQYISLEEMDYAIHGTDDLTLGDSEFKLSLNLLNQVLNRATAKFPKKTLRLYFETPSKVLNEQTHMMIIAQPLEEEEVDLIQAGAKQRIETFERKVLGIEKEVVDGEIIDEDVALDPLESSSATSKTDRVTIQPETGLKFDNPENDSHENLSLDEALGQSSLDQALQQLSITSGNYLENIFHQMNPEANSSKEIAPPSDITESVTGSINNGNETTSSTDKDMAEDSVPENNINKTDWTTRPFLAMKLTIRNRVNGQCVNRPDKLKKNDQWSVDYSLTDFPTGKHSKSLYRDLRKRLIKIHSGGLDMNPDKPAMGILERNLKMYIEKGRAFRKKENKIQSKLPKKVLDIAMRAAQSSENLRREAIEYQKKLYPKNEENKSETGTTNSSSSL